MINNDFFESFLIDTSDLTDNEVATEGVAEEIGKTILIAAGKGILSVLKAVGIMLGLSLGIGITIAAGASHAEKRKDKHLQNRTDEEKLSHKNFTSTWLPEFNKFVKLIRDDVDELDKKHHVKKYISSISTANGSNCGPDTNYSLYICGLEWSNCQYPDADGDDEGDPKKVKEFGEMLVHLKPYVQKWKSYAQKYLPYFILTIDIREPDKDLYFTDFGVWLTCKYVDRDGLLKPGFPPFKG